MGKFIDLSGLKFNRLTVIGISCKKNNCYMWECRCFCGNVIKVSGGNLKNSHTGSCGCLQKERATAYSTKHGMRNTRTYHSWYCMIQRCYNHNNISYIYYGNKGIIVCDNWKENFIIFLNDMGECPKGMSLDRINVNGNYEKSNCKWSTEKEQKNNKTNNNLITYNGETKTIAEWSDKLEINFKTLHSRLYDYKWTVEKSFTEPVRIRKSGKIKD